ncbi:MAG: hypothetical protein KBF71_08575, partial [Alphaproteobacteria bacterium]|nr:hypothetical protein [Alphaproteobacteria bacterium]
MSKISIPLPKVSDTSSPQKKAHQAKTAPAAASKKVPIVASEAKQSKPIQQRSTKVKEPKQPVAPPQAKQVKATPPAASKKAPVVKGEVKQSAPAQQKGAKKKQPKQPTAPQQAKQANPAPPKVPAKATPTPVGVPKISDVPKLQMPPAVKKQPSPVKSAPPAASKKAPVVKGEVKQSVPPQQKGKKSKKPKQPKQPTVPQQAKQVKVAPPKAPAKATLTPVAVPKIVNVPKNTSLEGLDELDLGFMPLDQLQEKLKQLIQEVLADPSHESFMLYFSFEKSDWEAF